MRYLTLLFLLIYTLGSGQTKVKNYLLRIDNKKLILKMSTLYLSGCIQGSFEANLTHYDIFKRVHKIKDDRFFDPEYSWQNKNKPGTNKARFFGSRTFLVGLTDYYHLSKQSFISSMVVGLSINIYKDKTTFKDFLIQNLCGIFIQKLGFNTTYLHLYK